MYMADYHIFRCTTWYALDLIDFSIGYLLNPCLPRPRDGQFGTMSKTSPITTIATLIVIITIQITITTATTTLAL